MYLEWVTTGVTFFSALYVRNILWAKFHIWNWYTTGLISRACWQLQEWEDISVGCIKYIQVFYFVNMQNCRMYSFKDVDQW